MRRASALGVATGPAVESATARVPRNATTTRLATGDVLLLHYLGELLHPEACRAALFGATRTATGTVTSAVGSRDVARGSNSGIEALTGGVPLVLLPLLIDQFPGAEELEPAGLGQALDPNAAASSQIPAVAERLLTLDGDPRRRLEVLSKSLRSRPGAQCAHKAGTASAFPG